MEIIANTKLSKTFQNAETCVRCYGPQRAKKISLRLSQIKSAKHLEELLLMPGRNFHRLTGTRKGEVAVVLDGGYRMIIRPAGEQKDYSDGESIIWKKVVTIQIDIIENYH